LLLVSLFESGVFTLDKIDPTKTDGTGWAEAMGATGSFMPSLSFRRFASGSCCCVAPLATEDDRTRCGFGVSCLKMQLGRSHLVPDGHAMLPKLLKAGIVGHMMHAR
jgi:hypothetical protein